MLKLAISVLLFLLPVSFHVIAAITPAPPPPRISLSTDGIHDDKNPALKSLQEPIESMKGFPKDRRNEVDWVKTLDQKLIDPRKTKEGKEYGGVGLLQEMDMDIIMKNTQYMPYVRFPHLAHTKWLDCSNCHPNIFLPQEGANQINMDAVLKGKYCGVCHDKVSFSLFVCERCHNIVHEGSGPKWW